MKRRILCVGACVALLLGACGCSGAASPSESAVPSAVTTATAAPTATTTTVTAAVTTAATTTAATTQAPTFGAPISLAQGGAAQLDAVLQPYSGQVSVGYYGLDSGAEYTYNPGQRYNAASLMKAPFCMYILQQASEGNCDLDKTLQYTEKFVSKGTGKLKNLPVGGWYSIRILVEYAIRYSDNAALRMLRSEFGTAGFTAYAGQLGIPKPEVIQLITNATITVEEALIYMKAIRQFIQNNPNGALLRQYMTSTTNPMIVSAQNYPVVRKYGWADKSFHDMAIVEAPHPYVLVILTDHEDGTAEDFAMFRRISGLFERVTA